MVGLPAPETLAAALRGLALPKGRARVVAEAPQYGAETPHCEIALGSPVRFVTSLPTSSLVSAARIRLGRISPADPSSGVVRVL